MKKLKTLIGLSVILSALGATQAPAQQALPKQISDGAKSSVPVAVQTLRWRMLDGDVNSLTFRSMDSLFTTRTVGHSGSVWRLGREDKPLDFSYRYKGVDHPAEDVLENTYTNALIVMKDGKIVYENYRNNSNERTRFMAFSMTKSITSVLVGCAVAEGRIKSVTDPVTLYLPELKGGGYDGATIRDILEMRSGVDYTERYDFANPGDAARNHIAALIKNVARFADAARTIKRLHKPGEVFQYKTLDTAVLGWLIERVSGQSVAAYTASRLWEPLGAEADGFYIMDGEPGVGREFSGAGFNATARDFARFGQMMLDQGVANGRRIIPADWVATSSRSAFTPDPKTGGYGYQWWTFPGTAYAALGLQGQYIFIDPATRTVVVKLSYFPPEGGGAPTDETNAFMAAASAWTPR